MNSRKIFIAILTVAVLMGAYLVYVKFAATPEFDSGSHTGTGVYDKSAIDGNMGNIGAARLGTVKTAVYKTAEREFGFEKLLHESGKEWTLEKPYMKLFEKNFVCGITADNGKVQIEIVANQPSPRDAKLTGNVVIHIVPDNNDRVKESFLYLDSIDYSSEKSLFSTDGPVHFVSADGEMVGKGLEVIFNRQKQRLELLHILHVDFMHLKTYKEASPIGQKNDKADKPELASDSKPAGKSGGAKKAAPVNYYQCLIEKNVVISYGPQTIYADKVSISNLFWAASNKKKQTTDSNAAVVAKEPAKSETKAHAEPEAVAGEVTEIDVKCDGGITVRPIEDEVRGKASNRLVEVNGNPVIITKDTVGQDGKAGQVEMAKCAQLKYNLDRGLLDMFADENGNFVALNLGQHGSTLQTSKSVFWNVKDNRAVINGPGTLYMPSDDSGKTGPAQMDFAGTMRVSFADANSPQKSSGPVSIRAIAMEGGLKGSMQKDNSRFEADSARLAFGQGNALSRADLNGNVAFDSNSGGMKAQKAMITFDKDPNGNVYAKNVTGTGNVEMKPGSNAGQRATIFKAQNIDYDLPNGYAVASGPVELKIISVDKVTNKELPVTITARDNAEYFQKKNKVVFNGAVNGTIVQKGAVYDDVSTFSSDKLVAMIAGKPSIGADSGGQKTGIEHLSLLGKVVKFVSCQQEGEKILNGLQLKCVQVDYNAVNESIWATGPGEIVVDNSKAQPAADSGGGVNFKGPCWVYVNNFRKLTFFKNENRILGEGVPSGLHIGYSPVKNASATGEEMLIDAGQLELLLTADRKISAINAKEGIIFDQPGKYYAQGNELHYTSDNNTLNIKDNCVVNGVSAEQFILNTDTLEGKVVNFKGAMVPLPAKNKK